jgi:DNA-binding response OmpR family regulator
MAKLLLIEDDAAQRVVASLALRGAGHTVLEAADGPSGLAAVDQEVPDLVVCDVMMPGMTGYDVLVSLRQDSRHASLPVILLTAMADREHMRHGMVAGADDYLTKPYHPDELCLAVESTLARKKTRQDAMRSSMSDAMIVALREQKERLGRQYESRLAEEISARWSRKATAAGDVLYATAVLLLTEVPRSGDSTPAEAQADTARRNLQAARDTLYLFGADHVLPYGGELLAVFAGTGPSVGTPAELRAVRAAFTLARSASTGQQTAISLHVGAVTLITVQDELHGDQGLTVLPGDAVTAVKALREFARTAGWRVASSPALAARLPREVTTARRASTAGDDGAIELAGLTA